MTKKHHKPHQPNQPYRKITPNNKRRLAFLLVVLGYGLFTATLVGLTLVGLKPTLAWLVFMAALATVFLLNRPV